MIGDYKGNKVASTYKPSKEVQEFTALVQRDFSSGNEILNKGFVELNGRSVIEDMNRGQKTFNAFVDETVENPAEAWKWRGTRSKARNKAVAMHAQITAGYIFPSFLAQNEDDEEDRDFSDMMDDSVEWLGHNSNYKSSFLSTTMGMLVNPVTYMGAEWCEVFQTIKEKNDEGYTKKEILDDVLSGFNAPVYSADQILISNAFEQNIQRHRFNITRRHIEYSEAEAKYGEHENWEYVTVGNKSVYNAEDGLFYDVKDDDHPFLVTEEVYKNRRDDTEVCFIGGIYMGNDKVDLNPIKHRDHKGAPKYNIVPFGYQRVNEHFFFYKSLMNSMYWDNQLADAQYELGMNTAFLAANMPTAVMGADKVDSDIIFPSAVVAFADKDVKTSPLLPGINPGALFQAFATTEASMDEASLSPSSMGQLPPGDTKATAIAVAQRNAETMLSGIGKTLAESVVQVGGLMADIVVNNLSTAQISEIGGDSTRMKYRTLILKDKMVEGKQMDKVIRFDESLLGLELSEEQIKEENLKMLEEIGYPENKNHLYRVNPLRFSMMKYLCRVEPEKMFPKNKEYMQAIYSQVYAQYQSNPFVSLEALTRKSLYAYFGGETESIMQSEAGLSQYAPLKGIRGDALSQVLGKGGQTQFGQQGQNKATGNAMAGIGLG